MENTVKREAWVAWWSVLFGVGFVGYPCLEVLWRGRTHISMAVAGGLALVWIGWVALLRVPAFVGAVVAGVGIGVIELGIGAYVNLYLGLGVWDYSALPYHLWGQVSVEYLTIWVLLSWGLLVVLRGVRRRVMAPRARD